MSPALKSPPRPAAPEKQKRFGKYTTMEHLGTGGMGDVYKAMDLVLNRTVALKILPFKLANNRESSERFLAEAHAISRLQHQNIVTIYDYGEEDGQKFIAMQFIQGSTLSKVIRSESPLDYVRIVNIAKQICRGLKYAHENEVVHRDIKSGNIIMAPGDKAYISDFGIAKVVDSPSITTTGMALGTPEYMAPEQCEGGVVDAQSDLYALGVMLHEMTAGKPPFLADTPLAVAFKQVHEMPPLLSKVRPDVPPRFELIVAKCLKKKKEERYRSADELLHDLDNVYLESGSAQGSGSTPLDPELRITDRRGGDRRYLLTKATEPRTLLIAAVILLVAMAGIMTRQLLFPVKSAEGSRWLQPTVVSGAKGSAELGLDLGKRKALQALYLEMETPAEKPGASVPIFIEVSLDGKKPLRYVLEDNAAPQALNLQGRVASKISLRAESRGAAPVIREARLLGLPYD